jgi:hypothetical protein
VKALFDGHAFNSQCFFKDDNGCKKQCNHEEKLSCEPYRLIMGQA